MCLALAANVAQAKLGGGLDSIDTSFGLHVTPDVIPLASHTKLGIASHEQLEAQGQRIQSLRAESAAMRVEWVAEEEAIQVDAQGDAEAVRVLEERARAEQLRKNEERLRVAEEKRLAEEERASLAAPPSKHRAYPQRPCFPKEYW